MQTCSRCNAQALDMFDCCPNCGADFNMFSETAQALRKFQENSRVQNIRLVVSDDACPACLEVAGTYSKNEVPALPVAGCSSPTGCRCFYEPMLTEIYP